MTMTHFAAALSLAVGSLASNAFAQTPATTPAPAPAAAPAPATAAPTPVSPAQRAAIKELLDTTKTRDNLARTFQAMSASLPQQMAQAMNARIEQAAITPEQKQKVRESMNQPFSEAVKEGTSIVTDPKLVDQAVDKLYPVYAKHFTLEDLKQLNAFYKSPLGAKTLVEMPQIINETMQTGVALFQPKLAALIDKTVKTQIDTVTAAKK
jgi:hypothetical protein